MFLHFSTYVCIHKYVTGSPILNYLKTIYNVCIFCILLLKSILRLSLLTHIPLVHLNVVQYFTVWIYHIFLFYWFIWCCYQFLLLEMVLQRKSLCISEYMCKSFSTTWENCSHKHLNFLIDSETNLVQEEVIKIQLCLNEA